MTTGTRPVRLTEFTQPQPESTDPRYMAFVEEKIRQGLDDLKADRTYSEDEVLKELGLKD